MENELKNGQRFSGIDKPQTTNHKPQTTNQKPQTKNHKPQTTNQKPTFAHLCIRGNEI